jgi:hypothetical protein
MATRVVGALAANDDDPPKSDGAKFKQTVLKRGIRRRWQYQSANEMGC